MNSGKGDLDPVGGDGNAKGAAGGAGHEEQKLPNIDDSAIKKDDDESADEDEEEENEAIGKIFDLPPEDIHQASKVVLQRQFFEAIVRSSSVKFANASELPTLSHKLEALFTQKLCVHAGKNKAKTLDEEVS